MGRRPGQQPHGGWCGNGDQAVGRPDHPLAGGHAGGPHLVHVQHFEGGTRADHVDDAVQGPYLVEMDLRWWPVVQPAFHLGQRLEDGQCPTGYPVGQGGLADHGQDVGRRPVDRGFRGPHLDLRPSQATP